VNSLGRDGVYQRAISARIAEEARLRRSVPLPSGLSYAERMGMAEMLNVICPVCSAHVAHEGRIIRGSAAEMAKCTHGNVGDCIELWRAWKRADSERLCLALSDAVRQLG